MIFCERCGQVVTVKGLCDDCIYVEGGRKQNRPVYHRGKRGITWVREGNHEFHMRNLDAEAEDLLTYWLRKEGKTVKQIAQRIGIGRSSMEKRMWQMGFKPYAPTKTQETRRHAKRP